jgi:hypothetical protein
MTERTARCLCGETGISASGAPELVFACCCHDCQLRSGSSFAYSAFFPVDAVAMDGAFAAYTRQLESGRSETTHRCPTCGIEMWFTMEALPGRVGVPAGIFREAGFPPPGRIYFTSRRHHWLPLPESVTAMDRM